MDLDMNDFGSDDFKVVREIRPLSHAPCAVHVFASKSNSWKFKILVARFMRMDQGLFWMGKFVGFKYN